MHKASEGEFYNYSKILVDTRWEGKRQKENTLNGVFNIQSVKMFR